MVNSNSSPEPIKGPSVPYRRRGSVRCIQLTETAGTGRAPLNTPTRRPYQNPNAASRNLVAFASTVRWSTPVGRISAEPSASTARRPPPTPLNSPTAPSTTGAGTAPLKLVGTGDWVAALGSGSAALIAFTRAVSAKCPNPPSEPEVPSTGLPPLTIIPARG